MGAALKIERNRADEMSFEMLTNNNFKIGENEFILPVHLRANKVKKFRIANKENGLYIIKLAVEGIETTLYLE
jgi:hypothetical protein